MIQIRRRTAIVAVVAFMLVAAVAITALVRTADAGGTFSDTPPWIEDEADWLAANGIANGYPDGTFRPNQNITRGQAAFWTANHNNAMRLETRTALSFTNTDSISADVTCGFSDRAVAGGGSSSRANFFMTDSYAPSPGSWRVRWESENDAVVSGTVDLWALCLPETVP